MKIFLRVHVLVSFFVPVFPLLVLAQNIQQTPYSAADAVRRGTQSTTLDLAPSNPLGMPGSSLLGPRGSENISISSGMFQGLMPQIPNLQLGYNYTFGSQLRAGSASVDYLIPFKIDGDTTVYGEAHGEFQNLSIAQPGSPNNSTELCFGGGYRRMLGKHTMVGLNSFFDTTKLSGTWYSSATAGLEFASMISGHDAIDFIFNWYGKALDATIFGTSPAYAASAATANFGNANFDFQVGYSHELYNGGPDLRLSATGYKLECGSNLYGYYGGAELKSRDGVYVVKYDVGYDNAFDVYQSVAAFVNMGLQLENLLDGKNPFVKPKPIFQSPRNMTTLTQAKPSRNWKHTTQAATSALVGARASNCLCDQTVTIYNKTGHDMTLYMGFFSYTPGGYQLPIPSQGIEGSPVFKGWTPTSGNGKILQTSVPRDSSTQLHFDCTQSGMPIAFSGDNLVWTGCNVTQFEINLCNGSSRGSTTDQFDISLVNGFNLAGELWPEKGERTTVCCAHCNQDNPNVYPYFCTSCNDQTGGPCTPTSNVECKNSPNGCNSGTPSTNWRIYIGGHPDSCPSTCPTGIVGSGGPCTSNGDCCSGNCDGGTQTCQ